MESLDFLKPYIKTSDVFLPTAWNILEKKKNLEVSSDGLNVYFFCKDNCENLECHDSTCSVKSNHPINKSHGIYYYEAFINADNNYSKTNANSLIASFGICTSKCNLNKLAGKDNESFGLHADGRFFDLDIAKSYSQPITIKKTIGCCLNFESKTVFFTIDGKALNVLEVDVKENEDYYPCVGLYSKGVFFEANFGYERSPYPFKFDFSNYRKSIQNNIIKEINSNFHWNENSMIEYIAEYLSDERYFETLSCLRKMEENKTMKIFEDNDNMEITKKRLEIHELILNDHLEESLQLLQKLCPDLKSNNFEINFEVITLKYLNLIQEKNFKGAFEFARTNLSEIYKDIDKKLREKKEINLFEMKKEIENIFPLAFSNSVCEEEINEKIIHKRNKIANIINGLIVNETMKSQSEKKVKLKQFIQHSVCLINNLMQLDDSKIGILLKDN